MDLGSAESKPDPFKASGAICSLFWSKTPPYIHDGSFPRSPKASKSHSPRKKLPKSALLLYKSAGQLDPVEKLASGGCDSTVKVWKLYNGNWMVGHPTRGFQNLPLPVLHRMRRSSIWTVAGEGDGWEGNVLVTFTPLFGEFHGGRLQGIYLPWLMGTIIMSRVSTISEMLTTMGRNRSHEGNIEGTIWKEEGHVMMTTGG
ncbi:hypothetical protein C4D60_Mb08t31040 [Musa balbisiana]|uniref:Uncharacterized protein n=1 Tax=Musa balbisiana TaxID=52838 RepID=A0A4S8K7R6_MUSBA|nr:hypothetical protein C4D60_Mb08t31040 [Musa balbisiana]